MSSTPILSSIQEVTQSEPVRTALADGPDLTRYLLICSGLIVAIAVLGWGFRRFLGGTLATRAARRSLRIVDSLPMGGRRRLAVVRCYDRTFLLGVGDREVNLVAELDAEDASDAIVPASTAQSGTRAESESFGVALGRALGDVHTAEGSSSRAAGILAAIKRGEGVLG